MLNSTKTIGILAHSYEGAALCFLTACREGMARMGEHKHPPILMSAIPMRLSMTAWNEYNLEGVGVFLKEGVIQLARAGADFYICPDNTAHLVLEKIANDLPLPGLHIAHGVCDEIGKQGWKKVALLGTNWTMTGSVYADALATHGMTRLIPEETDRNFIHDSIFNELCQSQFKPETIQRYIGIIAELKNSGAECVILGCTEIPLIITEQNSPLPILDSTRLLAKYAVEVALKEGKLIQNGWV
jgi:aspartate racemase